MANDDDFEINQEKVQELNTMCNIPVLAIQKSAECNANIEQAAECESMGMRTDEQGECEDINIFGTTPIPVPTPNPLVVEEGTHTGEGGDSEENKVGDINEDVDIDEDAGEGGSGGPSQSQSHEPKHEQEHEGSGE
jgi:hypothetical protein